MMPAVVKDQLPLIVLLLLVLAISSIDSGFMAPGNLLVVTADTMTLFLMAAGATFVIMTGGIDLSMQAVASMTSCIVAALLPKLGFAAALFAADIPKQIYTGWRPNLPFATNAVKDDAIVSVQFACDWSSHYKELDIEGMKTKCLRQQARPCTRR